MVAYSLNADTTGDKFEVKPFTTNPFDPPNRLFWVVCPTHQVHYSFVFLLYICIAYIGQKYDQCLVFEQSWWYKAI